MKALFSAALMLLTGALRAAITFQPGDHVVFVGNTFAERLSQHGYFEALMASRLPQLNLTFRNLGWSADTISGPNVRPLNFGEMSEHLATEKPDVIFACYGMSESFEGTSGLESFKRDLLAWVRQQRAANYNGKGTLRLVLVSPIAHERLGGKLPDPGKHNEQLTAYTAAMRDVAAAEKVEFLDLFTPTQKLMVDSTKAGASPLTFNGVHLTEYGYWVAAQLMAEGLGIATEPWHIETDAAGAPPASESNVVSQLRVTAGVLPPPAPPQGISIHRQLLGNFPTVTVKGLRPGKYELRSGDRKIAEGSDQDWSKGVFIAEGPAQEQTRKLLSAVDDKNQQFFYRWHAVNGEYIYGRRKEPFGVVNFPGEMKQLEQMVADRDQRIWELSQPAGTESFELVQVAK